MMFLERTMEIHDIYFTRYDVGNQCILGSSDDPYKLAFPLVRITQPTKELIGRSFSQPYTSFKISLT